MDVIQSLVSNLWSLFLVVLFFGGSIFVHELGHFLAARRRGVRVERFAIGFGPKIMSWRGKDGVEYRLCWLPLGGYVMLPQLADLGSIEGERPKTDPAQSSSDSTKTELPPVTYTTKVIVFAAGAFFNVLFAFFLACVLWGLGQQVAVEEQTNRVGVVLPQIEFPNGRVVPGPAFTAGVKPGDIVRAVDGKSVSSLSEIGYLTALGSGRGLKGEPKVDLTIERDGQTTHIVVFPQYVGFEEIRDIGIEPITQIFIESVQKGNAADAAGLKASDQITHLDDQPVQYQSFIRDYLRQTSGRPVKVSYIRAGTASTLIATPRKMIDPETKTEVYRLGVSLRGDLTSKTIHVAPWTQIERNVISTYRTLASLLSPRSDIGLSKLSSPIGIAERLYTFAKFDFRLVLWFAILINVNLAIFNLLPIPVLDGGHILFATVGKLRGRSLPVDFIATTQSIFIVLLFSMIIYVGIFDVRRIARSHGESKPAPAQAPEPAPAK